MNNPENPKKRGRPRPRPARLYYPGNDRKPCIEIPSNHPALILFFEYIAWYPSNSNLIHKVERANHNPLNPKFRIWLNGGADDHRKVIEYINQNSPQ